MLSSQRIKQELDRLVGLPVWGPTFAADMLMLQLGQKHSKITRRGISALVGDYALHIQVRWRLAASDQILVGSADIGADEQDPIALSTLIAHLKSEPKVVAVKNVFAGAFTLDLEGSLHFDVFPSQGTASDDEFWRVLRPVWESPHFVVSATGVE